MADPSLPSRTGDQRYALREDGNVFIACVTHDKFEVLSVNEMVDSVVGSPIPAANRLLILGEKHLCSVAAEEVKSKWVRGIESSGEFDGQLVLDPRTIGSHATFGLGL